MPFRIQVVLGGEILAVIGTLFRPYWGMLLLIFLTFVRPQDDRPNVAPLHIQGAITLAVLVATVFRPATFVPRLSATFRGLRWIFILFGLMILSAVANGWTVYSSDQLQDSLTIVIVCLLIALWIVKERRVRAVVWLLIAAGMYYFKMVVQNASYFRDDQFERISFRNATNFGNPNFLALLMVIVIFLSLSLFAATRSSGVKLVMLTAVGCCFFAFLKCQSRGGTLALAASFLTFWLMQRRKTLTLAVFGLAAGLGLGFLAPKTYVERLETIVSYKEDPSAMTRLNMWQHSLDMIATDPILGIGPGNFGPRFPRGMTQHEAYLQVASEAGLPALLIYISLLLGGIRSAWVARRMASPQWKDIPYIHKISEGLLCAVVAIMVAGFFTGLGFREFVYITLVLIYCVRQIAEEAVADEPEEAAVALPAVPVEA